MGSETCSGETLHEGEGPLAPGVLQGTLIAVLHHAHVEHFEKTLSGIIARTNECIGCFELCQETEHQIGDVDNVSALRVHLQSLSVIAGVRQGSKIAGMLLLLRVYHLSFRLLAWAFTDACS